MSTPNNKEAVKEFFEKFHKPNNKEWREEFDRLCSEGFFDNRYTKTANHSRTKIWIENLIASERKIAQEDCEKQKSMLKCSICQRDLKEKKNALNAEKLSHTKSSL